MQSMNTLTSENESVLIVDNEVEILESLRRRLELEGLSITTCHSSVEALHLMMQFKYNIVITDINMPGISGTQLLSAMKSINPLCNIIMMTGYSNMMFVVECLSSGACDYFIKPFEDLDILVDAARQAVERVQRWKKGMGLTVRRAY